MPEHYDFCGYATKNDLQCADGRVIRKNAFKDCDGKTVPLVYHHLHDSIDNVLGHAILEHRDDGTYCYGYFNETRQGKTGKSLVEHGDITKLSIYANKLKQNGNDVLHGDIKEVSLVLAGANPGAGIDFPVLHHEDTDEYYEADDECVIYSNNDILTHKDTDEDTKKEEKTPMPTKEKEKEVEPKNNSEETVQDVIDTMNEKQKKVLYALVGSALNQEETDNTNDSDEGDEKMAKHNVFDADERTGNYLTHDDMQTIFKDAKRLGSLRDSVEHHSEADGVLAHAVYNINDDGTQGEEQKYGIANINWLFPDARTLNTPPDFIKREMDWVTKVMNGTHHTPFSRIKSVFANITMDEARARGYLKGKLKKEEVFSLLKRVTTPQTIYKKQKLDRDDIIDITDFDVVAWLKAEMRMMLDEEIARAILIGDGRLPSDDDHISEEHIRPIYKDESLYTIHVPVEVDAAKPEVTAKNLLNASIRSRKDYKGSGNPVLFITEDWLTELLLLEDGIGHKMYKTESELATAMRVREVITVPVMEGIKNASDKALFGIIVNLSDYNVGADKGGAVSMFEDFDIDYNQEKYLIETRISGALTKPYSAIVLEEA